MSKLLPLVAGLTLAYFLWNISTTGFRATSGWDIDWIYSSLLLLYGPAVFVAWASIVGGIYFLRRKKAVALLSICLALPMACYSLYYPRYGAIKKHHAERDLRNSWIGGSQLLSYLLMKYIKENPNSIVWTGEDEEIDPSGFVKELKKLSNRKFSLGDGGSFRLKVSGNQVLTPWGTPVVFGVDRDHDGYVTLQGKKGSLKPGYAHPNADGVFKYERGVGCFPTEIPEEIFDPGTNYLAALDDGEYERVYIYKQAMIDGKSW